MSFSAQNGEKILMAVVKTEVPSGGIGFRHRMTFRRDFLLTDSLQIRTGVIFSRFFRLASARLKERKKIIKITSDG